MSPAAKVTEDAYAEQPALEWLGEVGWQHVHGPSLAPDGTERALDSDVVLHGTFRSAVARLNPDLPPEAVTRANELALTTTHASLVADHQDFHELLLAGVPVTWIDDEHGERSTRARLIDWNEPAGNVFQAVNQLTIVEGGANRRPDVLLYVNGLPLGQLELKNPSLDEDGPVKAVNQVRHYSKTIPPRQATTARDRPRDRRDRQRTQSPPAHGRHRRPGDHR